MAYTWNDFINMHLSGRSQCDSDEEPLVPANRMEAGMSGQRMVDRSAVKEAKSFFY